MRGAGVLDVIRLWGLDYVDTAYVAGRHWKKMKWQYLKNVLLYEQRGNETKKCHWTNTTLLMGCISCSKLYIYFPVTLLNEDL